MVLLFFHVLNRVPSKKDDPRNTIKASQPRIPNVFSKLTLCLKLWAINQLIIHTHSDSMQITRFDLSGFGSDGRNITQKPLNASETNAHINDSVILFQNISR
jgi:hypothetical protein